jgi:hypothetical protein
MDNLATHQKALRELPRKLRRRISVYWTPVNSSWLNLIESYFATLQRTALHNVVRVFAARSDRKCPC